MTPRPERSLLRALVVGTLLGTALGVALLVLRFELPLVAWALAGAAVGLAWWALGHLLPDDGEVPPEPMAPPTSHPSDPDRETRALHAQLRGAASGNDTTTKALHRTIGDLARERAGDGPYPPALAAYLRADPHPLSRARLRTILKELTRL